MICKILRSILIIKDSVSRSYRFLKFGFKKNRRFLMTLIFKIRRSVGFAVIFGNLVVLKSLKHIKFGNNSRTINIYAHLLQIKKFMDATTLFYVKLKNK